VPGSSNWTDDEAEDARAGSLNAGVAAAAAAAKHAAAAGRGKGGGGGGGGGERDGAEAGAAGDPGFSWSAMGPGREVIQNKHSTDVESLPPPPRVCMSTHADGKSCSNLGRLLVLNDPPAR